MTFSSGDNLYKFTLIKKLGGTFGEVWHARDNTLNKEVALKVLDAAFEPVAKVLDEARIGNKFNHKNLLQIHYADVCSIGPTTYTLISQEYLSKGTVVGALNSANFLPLPQTLTILKDILFGLEYLHNGGFYHNDIKPGNILLDDRGSAVLADYGIAGFSPTRTPVTPTRFYKIHKAPETDGASPIISIQTDIYQVGCTAFRLLNGISCLMNEFNSLGEVVYNQRKAHGKIPDRGQYQPFVPQRLRTIINKALNVDPARRFASALEMRRKLEKLNFSGYWTTDASSKLLGVGKNYDYRFEIDPKPSLLFDLTSFKGNRVTGTETRISAYCGKKLTNRGVVDLRDRFMDWVVENGR